MQAEGVESLPAALLAAGLAGRLGARRAGGLPAPDFDPRIDTETGMLNPGGLRDYLEQARHGGELTAAVEADLVARGDVTELGAVLTGAAEGRRDANEITLFDSTGLALQDLAIAKAAFAKVSELDLPTLDL